MQIYTAMPFFFQAKSKKASFFYFRFFKNETAAAVGALGSCCGYNNL